MRFKLPFKTTFLLLVLLTSNTSSFEFGLHTKGIDLGFLDHNHFKLLTSCEGFYSLDGLSSVRGSLTLRWFKFERNVFNINCMSGAYLQYNKFKRVDYTYSNYTMYAFGIKFLDIEPTVMFNDRVSLFIRCNILNINLLPRKWISAGMYEIRNDGSRAWLTRQVLAFELNVLNRVWFPERTNEKSTYFLFSLFLIDKTG
jgi:hypothetical protein